MSDTQEKQEHKCHWRAYGQPDGTVVCDECNTAADVNKLIDSAKREGAIGVRNLYGSPKCEALHHPKKYQHTAFEDCPVEKEINALIEQSEESE